MEGIKIVALAFILCGFQLYNVQCQSCEILEENVSGRIEKRGTGSGVEKRCWTIPVSSGHFIYLQFKRYRQSQSSCTFDYVLITIEGTSDVYTFCGYDVEKSPVTAFDNVTVTLNGPRTGTDILIEYTIRTIECLNKNSFKCDNNSCVSEEKVCDGVKDCKNGADEIGCETGVLPVKGVPQAIRKAVSWLKQKRTSAWGWRENTPRAIVALYLASAASFNGTVLEEELMAKQTELKTAVALLRPLLTNSELSMFINALLVTCHSPRHFYGNNLVERLKEQVEESGNFTHPLAYLALCNANESWPLKATSDLDSILSSNSNYPFVQDLQAMALTAISCEANRSRNIDNSILRDPTLTFYKNTIQHFKKLQAPDGSFGNVYTTALITQALFSSSQEYSKDWNLNATIKYLLKELNSSSVDFLTTYLALPILNGKSLMDISRVNCSANPRKNGDDPVSEINDYLGPKMRVQYSLYIGDERDVIHTISLRVPENYTASEIMELAEVEDPKYKFEWKMTSGQMYVYEIANVTNDPESGKFWLLYVGAANSSEPLTHLTNGPDEIIMGDGQHLVLWYKTATI